MLLLTSKVIITTNSCIFIRNTIVSHRTWTHIYVSKTASLNLTRQGTDGRVCRPSFQNVKSKNENANVFHTNTGKRGAGLEMHIPLSLSSTFNAFLLRIFSAKRSPTTTKTSLHTKPGLCICEVHGEPSCAWFFM